jgi:hypothetical protein
MGDNSLKSHGVDLKFSREGDFSGYFSVNLEAPEIFSSEAIQKTAKSGQSSQAYLTHPRMTEEKLFEVITGKKLNPSEDYHHPTLSRAFKGKEFATAYQEMIKEYTKNFADGLTKLVCESFDLGDKTVDITEVTGLSIRMNLGDRVAVLNFSEHWGKFLDRNLAPGISLRRIILALRKEKNPDKALELLKNTEEFKSWSQRPNIASLPAEKQVESFLRDYLNSNLPGYIRDFILEKLNKDLLFNQRTATDIIQIFSHSNKTPFVLRIEFTKIGAINFLQRRSYVDIPSTDFESLKLTPLSEKVTELFTQDQIASMSQVACYVMAWLLTEYRIAKGRGQPFADGEALRFLDALDKLYELHKDLVRQLRQQNLPQGQQGFNLTEEHTKNVFVWLRHLLLYDVRGGGEVASSRHEFREDLVRNFLRLFTPGYILEGGQDQYLAVSLGVQQQGVQHQGGQHVTVLFQRDIQEDEIGNLLRDRLLSLRDQTLQDSVRGDVLVAVRDGANMQSSGSQITLQVYGAKLEGDLNKKRKTIIDLLGLQPFLNWRLDGSVIEQLKGVDQERLEQALSPQGNDHQVGQIFDSLPRNVQEAYKRIRINLGQGTGTFRDFLLQGAQLANDDQRIQHLYTFLNPSGSGSRLPSLIQPPPSTQGVLNGRIIYDPLTGFRLQQ